jgi:hypothetical protein
MSRAPPNHQQLSSRNGLIDFVNVPLSHAYEDNVGISPSIYAQAGFPGYYSQQQLGVAYAVPQPIQPYAPSAYPQPIAAPACLSYAPVELGAAVQPVESEAVLHQRINEKIDSIIQAQRDSMLNSKIEKLANKVQQLSQNLESSDSAHVNRLSEKVHKLSRSIDAGDAGKIHRLSEQVKQLSQSLEKKGAARSSLAAPYEPADSTLHISAEPSDAEISQRLRRLAAESGARARSMDKCKIPDW